ncbi:MAG: peptide-methionine (R)-S-oxide reductase MsrB [Enterobacterales bacterium]|nr:peptide-methionine (R)-S-oxide reductase MsrB [Enterobacterales bacterium]
MNKDLKHSLSPIAYAVTQEKATEAPFSGTYHDFSESGSYLCVCCQALLFTSKEKFYSSCGWPAFHKALENTTREVEDLSHNMQRTEILCKNCDAHLGHKFADGPSGTRYCINSVSLKFVAD